MAEPQVLSTLNTKRREIEASAVPLRTDFSARELRQLAKRSRDNNQSRLLLSPAAAVDGMSRDDAARIGGMDHLTLRDWARVGQTQ